ncbi:MAG: alanine racemase [Hyphomonas oceanitis]|uniref:alanine racemase n=1 Tax=Hyphomonas oceanitis TaxID=81033 RepID=UPI0030023A5C
MLTEAAVRLNEMADRIGSSVHAEAGVLSIDLSAVIANYRFVQMKAPAARIGAVVKADAYGLGARTIAPALAGAGCRDFFVAHLAEALELVPGLPESARLYVLNGLAPGMEGLCAQAGIFPVLNTLEQARHWQRQAAEIGQKLPAVLQLDTGMSRLGLGMNDLETLLRQPGFLDWVDLRVVMSHLACADMPDAPANADQARRFAEMAIRVPGAQRSLANSAAAMGMSDHADGLVRPGLVLYGIDPLPGPTKGLRPAIALSARVIQIRTVPAGVGVGYDHDYVTPSPRRLATLSVGYADGWPRALGGKGAVWLNGVSLPLVGRVSMDTCTADVTEISAESIEPGDMVELIGQHQSVSDLATLLDTAPHAVLTGLGKRFERRFTGQAQ